MFNKVLVFWGAALLAILVIENLVVQSTALVFLSRDSSAWLLSLVSAVIWIWIGIGIKWFLSKPKDTDDNLDF